MVYPVQWFEFSLTSSSSRGFIFDLDDLNKDFCNQYNKYKKVQNTKMPINERMKYYKLYGSSLTAQMFGVSASSIDQQARRMGYKNPDRKTVNENIIKLIHQLAQLAQIAQITEQ